MLKNGSVTRPRPANQENAEQARYKTVMIVSAKMTKRNAQSLTTWSGSSIKKIKEYASVNLNA